MLYWILLVYLVVTPFFPVVGWLAAICMIAPVWMSYHRGRYWCGNFCPRGNFYDRVLSRFSRKRPIPAFLRTPAFRAAIVGLLFTMFGVQFYFAWGDWGRMGMVFWNLIVVTTIVGIVLGVAYSHRAWCTFCPMGSLSALVAPRHRKPSFRNIHIADSCVMCRKCARECPMQLRPYEAKGVEAGMMDPDCIKCGVCIPKCPKDSISMR